jgi:hypothetical protein
MRHLLVTSLALCLLLATACREQQHAGTGGTPPPQPLGSPSATGALVQPPPPGAGTGTEALSWTTPEGWVAETPSTAMRKAQYRVAGEAGDAECVVFYFGPGEGGDAVTNAQRWANQFTLADGRPGSAGMKVDSRKVGDIDVLVVEVGGTYQGGFRMQQPEQAPKPGQLLLAAIATGPDANWFFKLLGPEATVENQRAAFEDLVGSLKRGGSL